MRIIPSSELIINPDGSVFHLHLKPGQIADTIVLVGDPGRVETVAAYFDSREVEVASREFRTVTGSYKGKRLSVISTGIGTDNIDIVMTELDALVNINFNTSSIKPTKTRLTILRLGTSGALQPDIPLGAFVFARTSIGFDGLLNFYKGRDEVCEHDIESKFIEYVKWNELLPRPYFVNSDKELYELFSDKTVDGITISAPGFYAPQGRWVRLEPADTTLNEKIESFRYNGRCITNYEMESSAIAGLSMLMGHRAGTICTIIAQRAVKESNTDYSSYISSMIEMALSKLLILK